MIRKDICEKVLVIGIDYRDKGGIAAVEKVYSTFYKPFNFVRTVVDGNKFIKFIVFVEGIFHFLYYMLFSRIEIVHVHGASDASFWRKRVFIYIAKFFGKKVVYHIHGGGFEKFAKKNKNAVSATLMKCDKIVVISDYWKNCFVNDFCLDNVSIIKNVIATPCVDRQMHSEFTLLFLGLLTKNKGIYDLVDILSENKDKYEGRLRLIVGGNGDVDYFKGKIHECGLENIMSFKGWLSGNEKSRAFNSSDVYILPSYIEGLPISILEAMSYGLPVISTYVGGIPEIVHNGTNGLLFEAGDKIAMGNCIETLFSDEDLRTKMGANSSKMVREHLPSFVEKQLEELYGSILKLSC